MHVQEHVTGREFSLHLRVWLMKKDFVRHNSSAGKRDAIPIPSAVAPEILNIRGRRAIAAKGPITHVDFFGFNHLQIAREQNVI
jgi:hypothetical protein